MPSDRADRHLLAGRARWWAAGLVLSVAVTACMIVLDRNEPHAAPVTPLRARALTDARSSRAAVGVPQMLGRLAAVLEHGSAAQLASLAAPGDTRARHELVVLRGNVRRLRIRDLTLRYVDGAPDRRRGVSVRLGWRLGGLDAHRSLRKIALTLRSSPAGVRFVTARRRHGDAEPLWLLTRVRVVRTAGAAVVSAAAVPPRLTARVARLADRAVPDVRRVLPRWHGPLVVEVPDSEAQLTAALGAAAGTYDDIAAVTTTADGSLSVDAPVRVFVNPSVLDRLGPRGGRVVMSHEATHVATGAAVSSMPMWLLEGFADYVALSAARLPAREAASDVLARVRRAGPPAHLPDEADFDPSAGHSAALGASYEGAWLACRMLAHTYGERRLVAFYRVADRTSTTEAFRTLGTDQRTFTRAWQRDLRRLAR